MSRDVVRWRQNLAQIDRKDLINLVKRGISLWKDAADYNCGDCDGYGCTERCKWHDWHRDAKKLMDRIGG
jgi:hypothetical protein